MLGMMCDVLAPAQNNRVLGAIKSMLWVSKGCFFVVIIFSPIFMEALFSEI